MAARSLRVLPVWVPQWAMALLWAANRKRFSRLFMRVRGQRAGQSTSATDRKMTLPELPLKWILMAMLLLGLSLARPQQFLLAEDLITGTGSGTGTGVVTGTGNAVDQIPINDPSGRC